MSNNIHQASIPADVLAEALGKLGEVKELLAPFAVTLTVDQRQSLPKMGDKSLPFVEKAHELALLNPQLLPAFVSQDDFTVDFTDAHNITPLAVTAQQVQQVIDDTRLLAGSEAYQAALSFYNSVKQATKQNVPGAKAVYDALKARFAGTTRRNDDATQQQGD
jgi:hypothetical protein